MKRLVLFKLPAATAAGSFLALVILVLTTNPSNKIAYAMFFFLFLLVFLISAGHLLIARFRGSITTSQRYRIFVISIFITVLLMFRSAQSLGWLEVLVLAILTSGLLFYGSRRA